MSLLLKYYMVYQNQNSLDIFLFIYTSWMMKDNYLDPKCSSQINHSLFSTLRNFYCDEKV